jgi:hypothetical protein
MDTPDEHDDRTRDGDYRQRAIANLDAITQQTKQALSDAGINIDIFFVIPSIDSIITYGTVTDPDPSDEEWESVSAIVSNIVRQSLRLDRTRCQPVQCATTASTDDHQPSQSTGSSDSRPVSAPALQHSGADR